MKDEIEIAVREYVSLREDSLQTRDNLQKMTLGALGLASLTVTLLDVDAVTKSEVAFLAFTTISVVFTMLGLVFLGKMRQYLNTVRYLHRTAEHIREGLETDKINPQDAFPVLYWESFNREAYRGWRSTVTLWFTFGMQSVIPMFFALCCLLYAIFYTDVPSSGISIGIVLFSMILILFWVFSLIDSLYNLSDDISDV